MYANNAQQSQHERRESKTNEDDDTNSCVSYRLLCTIYCMVGICRHGDQIKETLYNLYGRGITKWLIKKNTLDIRLAFNTNLTNLSKI